MSSSAIESASLGYGGFEDMSFPYNDLPPVAQDHREFTNFARSPTALQHQQPRSGITIPGGQSFARPHHSSPTASRSIDCSAKYTASCISTVPFSSPHSSPSTLDKRLHPASGLTHLPDLQHPTSSTKPSPGANYAGHRVLSPTEDSAKGQKKHQVSPFGQYQQGPVNSGKSNIPNLLGPDRGDAVSEIMFRLSMRQQPQAARACGFGDRDRRVIDPPPIVQLCVDGPSLNRDEARSYLRYESYVMNCSICDESGTQDASFMPEEYQHQRRLMGSLVGTPFVGQDDNGEEGCFFCFSDLSCRTPGAFRLRFTLFMIDPARARSIRHFPVLTEIMSDVFYVYSAKEFPGMLPSSNLAKRLKEQGCIISIKKGNDRSKNARGQSELSNEEEMGGGSQGQRKRRTIRD